MVVDHAASQQASNHPPGQIQPSHSKLCCVVICMQSNNHTICSRNMCINTNYIYIYMYINILTCSNVWKYLNIMVWHTMLFDKIHQKTIYLITIKNVNRWRERFIKKMSKASWVNDIFDKFVHLIHLYAFMYIYMYVNGHLRSFCFVWYAVRWHHIWATNHFIICHEYSCKDSEPLTSYW